METEQILFYSENCYGTADAIAFRKNILRVHDLKTGIIQGSMHQLEVYVALFCLEYGFKPGEMIIETRIYQNDEVIIDNPTTDVIAHLMSKIVVFDQYLERLKIGG